MFLRTSRIVFALLTLVAIVAVFPSSASAASWDTRQPVKPQAVAPIDLPFTANAVAAQWNTNCTEITVPNPRKYSSTPTTVTIEYGMTVRCDAAVPTRVELQRYENGSWVLVTAFESTSGPYVAAYRRWTTSIRGTYRVYGQVKVWDNRYRKYSGSVNIQYLNVDPIFELPAVRAVSGR